MLLLAVLTNMYIELMSVQINYLQKMAYSDTILFHTTFVNRVVNPLLTIALLNDYFNQKLDNFLN